jgi:hypothetical protein
MKKFEYKYEKPTITLNDISFSATAAFAGGG